MAKRKIYSFEKPRKNLKTRSFRVYYWVKSFFKDDTENKEGRDIFNSRLAIAEKTKMNQKERFILESFVRNNLHNIFWYAKRIRKEQRKLNRFYIYTLILLIGVPILIFISTSGIESDSDLVNKLLKERKIESIITLLVTLLLSLHKFISGWMDQRKIVVEFSNASVELKKVYYNIETLHFGCATDKILDAEGETTSETLNPTFLTSLSDGIVLSRRIVDIETKNYYQLRAQPTFNIANIWDNSAATAKKAFGLFKSQNFDPKSLEGQVKTLTEKAEAARTDIEAKNETLAKNALKIKQKRRAAERISIRLDELEILKSNSKNGLSDKEAALYEKLHEEFDELDDATDALEEEYEKVSLEAKILENRLSEIQGEL